MNIKKLFACLGSSVFLFAAVAGCAPKVIESEELLAPQWEAPSYETDVKVGAIRWDAWIGEVSPAQGETVEV